MSPLAKIKQGILEENLSLIVEGYEELSGDKIAKAKPKRTKKPAKIIEEPEDEQEHVSEGVISLRRGKPARSKTLYTGFDYERDVLDEESSDDDRKKAKKEPINLEKVKVVGNTFEDDMSLETKNLKKEKKMYVKPPVPRGNRDGVTLVKVTCTCGKSEKLYSNQIYLNSEGEWICNKCIISKGR